MKRPLFAEFYTKWAKTFHDCFKLKELKDPLREGICVATKLSNIRFSLRLSNSQNNTSNRKK